MSTMMLYACSDDANSESADGADDRADAQVDAQVDSAHAVDATVTPNDGSSPDTGAPPPDDAATPVPDAGEPDAGEPDADVLSTADAGGDSGSDAGTDAGTTVHTSTIPECTGSGLGLTEGDAMDDTITKFRVAADGSLYVLTQIGTLHKYSVSAATTACALTPVAGFEPPNIADFDLDAAGKLYVITDVGFGELDPSTGAPLSAPQCFFHGQASSTVFGRLGVSPDGTKASVVSTGSFGNDSDAGASAYGFTVAVGATSCTATPWTFDNAADCKVENDPTVIANALRMDGTHAYLACNNLAVYDFGGSKALYATNQLSYYTDIALSGSATVDTPNPNFQGIDRFNRTTGAFVKTFTVSDLLGDVVPTDEFDASYYRIYALSEAANGKRFVALATDLFDATHIYRIDDF